MRASKDQLHLFWYVIEKQSLILFSGSVENDTENVHCVDVQSSYIAFYCPYVNFISVIRAMSTFSK